VVVLLFAIGLWSGLGYHTVLQLLPSPSTGYE
jgi:hypothetical protein